MPHDLEEMHMVAAAVVRLTRCSKRQGDRVLIPENDVNRVLSILTREQRRIEERLPYGNARKKLIRDYEYVRETFLKACEAALEEQHR